MLEEQEAQYFRRREAVSRDRAAKALNAEIRKIHSSFADAYALRVQAIIAAVRAPA